MVAVIKPSFVLHEDDKSRPGTIFSLDVSSDGSRLATAGLDQKIKIWNTAPILDEEKEDDAATNKLLSTLGSHTGVVLCVRWSPDGHYLASGSDDNIVIVWEKDENATGRKVFGQTQTNHEVWNPVRRLVGHESDVGALGWSDDGYYLASGGTDSTVLVWDAETFALVRRISYHSGMVKGLAFDPVGEFLATQSDDRSVCVWRTTDWSLVSQITEPFVDSPNASWFRRLSWSPEGAFLAVPNSVNNGVFVAGILQRKHWSQTTSLIGHDNVIDVTAFNPICFLKDPKKPASGNNLCDVLAVAARSVISIWLTSQIRPIVVFDTIVDREVLDLSWSRDGTTLYACSSEGHIAVVQFTLSSLGNPAPEGAAEKFRANWKFQKPIRQSNGMGAGGSGSGGAGTLARPNILMARKGKRDTASTALLPVPPPYAPQDITILPNGKRRIKPAFLGLGGIVPQPLTSVARAPTQQAQSQQQQAQPRVGQFGHGSAPSRSGVFPQSFASQPDVEMIDARLGPLQMRTSLQDIGMPSWGLPQERATQAGLDPSRKRKAIELDPYDYDVYPRSLAIERPPGRALGGDRPVLPPYQGEVVELRPAYVPVSKTIVDIPTEGMLLAVPATKTLIRLKWDHEDEEAEKLEARNFKEANRPSEVAVISKDKVQWLDYLPSAIINATFSPNFTALSCDDKTLHVYSATGRTIMPTMVLDAPCAFLDSAGQYLLALTAKGTLAVWDTRKRKAVFKPASVSPLLNLPGGSANDAPLLINAAKVRSNGSPVISLSNGTTLSYDSDLESWIEIGSTWWSKGSEHWESRIRSSTTALGRGTRDPVKVMESEVNDYLLALHESQSREGVNVNGSETQKEGTGTPTGSEVRESLEGAEQTKLGNGEDWKIAMTLAHLESRMNAAVALDSLNEYRMFLCQYARKVAEEGYRGKAEELVKDLLGPVYYKPGRDDVWQPTLLNTHKHILLKEVLGIFGKSKSFSKLASDTNDILKKMASDNF